MSNHLQICIISRAPSHVNHVTPECFRSLLRCGAADMKTLPIAPDPITELLHFDWGAGPVHCTALGARLRATRNHIDSVMEASWMPDARVQAKT